MTLFFLRRLSKLAKQLQDGCYPTPTAIREAVTSQAACDVIYELVFRQTP